MKKFFFLFLSLVLISEAIVAVPACHLPVGSRTKTPTPSVTPTRVRTLRNGFTVGSEFGLGILNPPLDVDLLVRDTGWIRPSIAWQNNRFGGGLELSAEIGIPFWFMRHSWAGMDFDFSIGYERDLSLTNSLAFILESESYVTAVNDKATPLNVALNYADVEKVASSWLIPGIRFTQELRGLGTFYAEVDIPLYVAGEEDSFSLIGLDFNFTLNTDFGFGIEASIKNAIKNADGEASFFEYLYLTPSYIIGPVYASLGVGIPTYENGIDKAGFSLTPSVQYAISYDVTAYLTLLVSQLKLSLAPPAFGLSLGVLYSF